MFLQRSVGQWAWVFLACVPRMAAETVLLDFGGYDPARAVVQDARLEPVRSPAGAVLRVVTGRTATWPGLTVPAPAGRWDLSAFSHARLGVRNAGTAAVTVFLRVDNPGADGVRHCRTGSVALEPGQTGWVRVDLRRTQEDRLGGALFGLRGYPVKAGGDDTVDAAQVNQVVVFVHQPKVEHTFELLELRAAGSYTAPTAWTGDAEPYFPLIDTFGQYRHKDWPGKVRSRADLEGRRAEEARALAADAGPGAWDRFGGWAAGPRLEATGFFRVAKHAGKWWLIDPAGALFWSHGVDCVRMLDVTAIEERETWFAEPPWQEAELAEFLVPRAFALKGHYAGRSPRCFGFAGANWRRKYGPDWQTEYPPIIHRRLRAWGLNTIANWSDAGVRRLRRTPYTDNVGSHGAKSIEASEGYWGKFPDVFDPSFAESVGRSMAGHRGGSAGDPWCVGYFSDNEMSWGDDVSLAEAALRSPATQAAKRALVADLRSKYGEIGRLNDVWGTAHGSWDALLGARDAPDRDRARADLTAFYSKTAGVYFRTVRDAIKAVAPRQLYLGCRFAWANARAVAAAAEYCDVVSYNLYQRTVADFRLPGGLDVPLVIGEFHFGALDRGLFHTGLVSTANQAERAAAYRAYVEGALRHPQFVGAHWFQYQDEPTTGRVYDEENYQIGFVDVADTPYPELTAASRAVGEAMYRLRLGP